MSKEIYRPRRLEERGVRIDVPIEDPDLWQKRIERDSGLPKDYTELRALVDERGAGAGTAVDAVDPEDWNCGEGFQARIFGGLANPGLRTEEREAVEAVLADAVPTVWETHRFDRFFLRWSETDPNPANNFSPDLVEEAATLLKSAWDRLEEGFGQPSDSEEIEIVFRDLGGFQGQAHPPRGPLELDASFWSANPRSRAPLAAHELFHIFQYSFGYRDSWPQVETNINWLAEGTARWAEVFLDQRLVDAAWLTRWMTRPHSDLLEEAGRMLPFWIFFDTRFRPGHVALRDLLEECRAQGGARAGLESALDLLGVHERLADFLERFAASIFLGDFRNLVDGTPLYPRILGPDGQAIVSRPVATEVLLPSGAPFRSPALPLGAFAANYHVFSFLPQADGLTLRLRALADSEVSFRVIQLLGGMRVADPLRDTSTTLDHVSVINRQAADSLALVTSSRGIATSFAINAELA